MSDEELEEFQISRFKGQRDMQKKRMERQVRRSQIWLERTRRFLRFFIIILLLFVGYKLIKMPQWYMDKGAFSSVENKSLEILNNRIVPSYKILAVLRNNEVPSKPIYMAKTDEIKASVMQLEPIQDVFIRRFGFPARIQVIVQERIPIVTIAPDEKVEPIAFFATGGKLIGREYMPLDKSFKTIKVLSYGVRGDDYRNWDEGKIKLIEKLAKMTEHYSKEPVEYIDFRNPNDIYIKIKTSNIRLGVIDDKAFERIQRIPSILPQVKTLDKKIKYIDLRWNDANYIKLE